MIVKIIRNYLDCANLILCGVKKKICMNTVNFHYCNISTAVTNTIVIAAFIGR